MTVVIAEEPRRITRRAGQANRPIIAVEGCLDRPAAQALQGQELLARREEAPDLPEDEWWVDDLEGCRVRDGERVVGKVARLLSLPSVDVLEITRGSDEPDLLVPLVDDAVRSVDVNRREIEIDLHFLGQE